MVERFEEFIPSPRPEASELDPVILHEFIDQCCAAILAAHEARLREADDAAANAADFQRRIEVQGHAEAALRMELSAAAAKLRASGAGEAHSAEQFARLQDQLDEAIAARDVHEGRASRLRAEAATVRETMATLEAQVTSLRTARQALLDRHHVLEEELSQARVAARTDHGSFFNAEAALEAMSGRHDEACRALSSMQEERAVLEAQHEAQLGRETETRHRDVHALRQRLEHAQIELAEARSHLSTLEEQHSLQDAGGGAADSRPPGQAPIAGPPTDPSLHRMTLTILF